MDKTIIELRKIDGVLEITMDIDGEDDFKAAVIGLVSVLNRNAKLKAMTILGTMEAENDPDFKKHQIEVRGGFPWDNK